ncbi:MAG: response regulator, partial [Gallionellaceae bacterium]|nr:response regulator [Gallionellaceae bacterium]
TEKWVLVVDDMEGMRSQLRMSLTASGFAKLHLVGSIKEALERMSANKYDVILCDYSLGDSTDGQQFLEYLRTNDLIKRNTLFIIITAEQAYEKVVAASECAPDDYLLKPFTAAQFDARLEKLLEKQAYFEVIDKATDAKNWARVVAECDKKLPAKDRYFIELCKIRGSALMRDNRAQDAVNLYKEVLALRPVGWARLGLARALAQLDKKVEAQVLVKEILADSPQFMAAYDFMGKLLSESGEKDAALSVLQKAREVSPGTMSRVRELSSLAVSAGKPEIAEAVMKQALQKHKFSPVRQANDYAVLSKALVNQGKAAEALIVVADAQKSFNDDHSTVLLSATESVAHRAAGNHKEAEAAITKAMAHSDISKLSAQTVISLADACFAMGKDEEATNLLHHAIQNNHEDEAIKGKVHAVLTAAGKDHSEATAMIEASAQEVILLNNDGVRKAQAGQLAEAIELLCQAANRLPNNLQIVSNAALVTALDLVRNGNTPDKFEKCIFYRNSLVKKAPSHPKLAQIDDLIKQLK